MLALSAGNIGSQFVMVALLPLITRLYDPEALAGLQALLAASSFFALVANMRLDVSLMMPATEEAADDLLRASLQLTLFMVLLLLAGLPVAQILLEAFGVRTPPRVARLVPFGAGALAISQLYYYHAVRRGHFGLISASRLWQSTVTAASQLGFAFLFARTATSLFFGVVMGNLAAAVALRKPPARGRESPQRASAVSLLRQYLPKSSLNGLTAALEISALYAPFALVTLRHGNEVGGEFALASRIATMFVSFVGYVVGTPIMAAVARARNAKRTAAPEVRPLIEPVFIGALALATLFGIGGRPVFILLFGKEWGLAGSFARIVAPSLAVAMLSLPLGTASLLLGKERVYLAVRGVQVCSLLILGTQNLIVLSATNLAVLFALSDAIVLGWFLFFNLRLVGLSLISEARRMITPLCVVVSAFAASQFMHLLPSTVQDDCGDLLTAVLGAVTLSVLALRRFSAHDGREDAAASARVGPRS